MSILNDISENLQRGKAKVVKELVQQAIDDGIPARQILEEGLLSGMNVVGEKFKANEVFVPEVLVAARAMNMGTALLKPLLAESGMKASGGLSRAAPMFIARAATSTSGTNTSLFLNFSPTTLMPLSRPSSRICWAGIPSSMAC